MQPKQKEGPKHVPHSPQARLNFLSGCETVYRAKHSQRRPALPSRPTCVMSFQRRTRLPPPSC
eukprot:1513862-Pleurochrysis_carterae.AAC.1